jgi:hypothetical protein
MPQFGRDSKRVVERTLEPVPPREPPGVIDGLTVSFRELNEKRDRLEGDVDKLRRRLAEAEGELDLLQRSWWPSQLDAKQRLEQYRDKLRAHLGVVSSDLDATKASIPAARAALVRQYAVAQASRQPAEALSRRFLIGRRRSAGAGAKAGMSVPPMNVMLPGRPSGRVGHTRLSGWRVCESRAGVCAGRFLLTARTRPPAASRSSANVTPVWVYVHGRRMDRAVWCMECARVESAPSLYGV